MRIAVKALPQQREEWLAKQTAPGIEVIWVETGIPNADAYFDLAFEEYGNSFETITEKPVFASSLILTLKELGSNVSRINAWNGFLKNEMVEVVFRNDAARQLLQQLGWKYQEVPDVPGMIAPRTIAMIINEAYFALGDEVSTKEEIDIAMRLGTNYPYGPFEWCNKIGLHNVYRLLQTLAQNDDRYLVAPALAGELKAIA